MDEELKYLLTGAVAPSNSGLPVGKTKSESLYSVLSVSISAED